jgi:hypothetical protein
MFKKKRERCQKKSKKKVICWTIYLLHDQTNGHCSVQLMKKKDFTIGLMPTFVNKVKYLRI